MNNPITNVAYDPWNDPVVQQRGAMAEIDLKKHCAKMNADSWREDQKVCKKLLDGALTRIEDHNGRMYLYKPQNGGSYYQLFDGIVEYAQAVWCRDICLGYRFKIRRASDDKEIITGILPKKDISSIRKIREFLGEYFLCNPLDEKNLDHLFKNYLLMKGSGTYFSIVMENPGWVMYDNCFQYIYHGCQEENIELLSVAKAELYRYNSSFLADTMTLLHGMKNDAKAAFLLLYHFAAVFRRFAGYPAFGKNLVLVGELRKLNMACDYLKVLHITDGDIVVAANSNVKAVQNMASQFQDDIMLISFNNASKYAKQQILNSFANCIHSDEIGSKLNKTLPVYYEPQITDEFRTNAIYIDLDTLCWPEDCDTFKKLLGEFSFTVINIIKRDGMYWPDQILKTYKEELVLYEADQDYRILEAMLLTTAEIMYKMISEKTDNEEHLEELKKFIQAGLHEVKNIVADSDNYIDLLLSKITELTEERKLTFHNIGEKTDQDVNNQVYYDTMMYYFPKTVMEDVILSDISSPVQKMIIRDLYKTGNLHCYSVCDNGYITKFTVRGITGNQSVRGYQIYAKAFEVPYGIRLFERRKKR